MGEAKRSRIHAGRRSRRNNITISLISLGCPKNLVDSEQVLGFLSKEPILLCPDPRDAEVILINTCAFIEDARKEAIDTILEAATLKMEGACRVLIVMGCLVEKHRLELEQGFPEVDAFLSFLQYPHLPSIVKSLLKNKTISPTATAAAGSARRSLSDDMKRAILTPPHYAYLRIAEGCDNCCTYCTVPSIRGPFYSKARNKTLEEARMLAKQGVKEIIVIAQDTTSWGKDLPKRPSLFGLLESLSRIRGLQWIRLMYTHPAMVDEKLILTIAENEKICKYIDLPIQHCSDRILTRMGRRIHRRGIEALIKNLREKIPVITLRTSLIVGFPGEGKKEFEELLNFVQTSRFERLGVFKYSKEEGTPAAKMKGQVPRKIIESRFHRLLSCQQEIAFENNRRLKGKTIEVMVDHVISSTQASGRSQGDAPDIDSIVHIRGNGLQPGSIVNVRITGSKAYDLEGEVKL